ncbi:uncharacterized protein A1O9_02202 [Exophiala aquamarina CBS 119918]|uniref:Proteophosphoglycan 5 n=1 Tax=Exophiala aquamarina CBS 119918 TaxID=1182545 RepID=A0A072PL83_9EURO|nr:uncharacterized protein A1O9_02202 [Exophiala aquamarina CBS 119918]KEF60641.1 hypothetical protein A1O9_02202 [Exophiala aquamarina CBS 119918]
MSTPQQQSTKAARRSGKKPRPSEPQDAALPVSAPETHNTPPKQTKNNPKGQPRRSSHAQNFKNHIDGNLSDRGKYNNPHLEKNKATPVKQPAYAGSTFQQSPAASALPMPSFYSKSLPTAGFIPPQPTKEPSPPLPSSATPPHDSPSKRESTPCDFLFEAARQAKATPRGDSPANFPGNLSVPTGSPASRSPGPKEGDQMFPFELDGAAAPGEDGLSFATPYKDRMAALRSTRSTSQGVKNMDETERKAKTEALKKLLMKSSGQNGNPVISPQSDPHNPFNAKAPHPQNNYSFQGASLVRPNSNPSTPVFMQERKDYHSQPSFSQIPYYHASIPVQTPKRPASSGLRNVYGAQNEPEYAELSSDSAITPPATTTWKKAPRSTQQFGAFVGQPYAPQPQMPTHRSKPSAQQLEDDLRRVLKLDLTSRG